MTDNQHISKAYLAWLTATILFLSIGLFLFIQKLETFGTPLLGAVSFPVHIGIVTVLAFTALLALYKSLKSEWLKPKYRWMEGAMLACCLILMFLLEILSRQELEITTIVPFININPSEFSMPFLLLALGCALISKRYNEVS